MKIFSLFFTILLSGCLNFDTKPKTFNFTVPASPKEDPCPEKLDLYDYSEIQGNWVIVAVQRATPNFLDHFWAYSDESFRIDQSYFHLNGAIDPLMTYFLKVENNQMTRPYRDYVSGHLYTNEFRINNNKLCNVSSPYSQEITIDSLTSEYMLVNAWNLFFPENRFLFKKVDEIEFEKAKKRATRPLEQLTTDYETTQFQLDVLNYPVIRKDKGHISTCSLFEKGIRIGAFESLLSNNSYSSRNTVIRMPFDLNLEDEYQDRLFNLKPKDLPNIEIRFDDEQDFYFTNTDETRCTAQLTHLDHVLSGKIQCDHLGIYIVKNLAYRTVEDIGVTQLTTHFRCDLRNLVGD